MNDNDNDPWWWTWSPKNGWLEAFFDILPWAFIAIMIVAMIRR